MSLTIRLNSIRCVEEVNEASASEEPYVLLTAVQLQRTLAGIDVHNMRVSRYGVWEDFDAGEVVNVVDPPFWGLNSTPEDLTDTSDVIFIVTLMENDNGDPNSYRQLVEAAGAASLGATVGERDRTVRASRLLQSIRDALNGIDLPIPFALDDDHIGTEILRLDSSDLIPFGSRDKSLTFQNSEGHYELTFRITSARMWRPWFHIPGPQVFDHEKQQIAAVSRVPGNLDLFVIGFDNHVWTTFWNDAVGWNGEWFRIPGQAVFDHEKQQIAVVSRAPGNLDLFVIGFDNHVWTTFWNDAVGWNTDWFPIPGQTVFSRERQQIAAASRAPGNLDLFVIGFDNRVWTTFWNSASGWNGEWFQIPAPQVFDHEKQHIAAVSRAPGNLDLFVIGFDNRVWTTFWNDAAGWNGEWFPIPAPQVFDRERQQIAAVSRAPGNLDLFVIGFDNHVWTTFWNDAVGWNGEWFPIPGPQLFDHERQQIAAVSRAPGNLDLFVIGFDLHVWTTFWNDASGWNAEWFPMHVAEVFDRERQRIAAVSRTPNNLDLFVIGFDNAVWSAFWTPV
jgi:hypothetical protein